MPGTGRPPARTVGSVERALALLDALAESPLPLGTNELARRVGTNTSSVSRLLGTLAAGGLVERLPDTGRYRLGVRLVELGASVQARLDVRAVARPLLERLEAETGETATLSLPATQSAVTIDFVPSRASVRSMDAIGRRSIAHATAVGKVMLAFGEVGVDALPTPYEAFTERTITDPAALRAEVDAVRDAGAARAEREREADLNAVAAPVLDHRGVLVAILGLQGPAGRFSAEAMATALPALRTAAAELGRALGAR
jgi:IclR family acetate operon transcriptional repressor